MSNKIKTLKGPWNRNVVEKNSDCLFIFGDNELGQGSDGYEVVRGLPNVLSIPVKKYPSNHSSSFYTDLELENNKKKMFVAGVNILRKSNDYKYVIFPQHGIGTGPEDLPNKAPLTYAYLLEVLDAYKHELELMSRY